MTSENYDLVVIGSGPAGEKGATLAAYFGKKVALVEMEPVLGGAAVNTGALPSKTLRETALFFSGYRNRDLAGLQCSLKPRPSVQDFLARERVVKERERARIQENLNRHRVTLYAGTASFVDAHTIAIQPARCPAFLIRGEVILIASGTYPHRPPNFPFHDPRVYDSDTILTLHEIPATMLVVGGGVIGCEYACIFAALGIQVAVVERETRLNDFLDAEISEALRAQMEDMGIRMFMPDTVDTIDDKDMIEVRLRSGTVVQVETILVSAGRCGNTAALALDRIGIDVTERGRIKVNEHYQSSVPHVYAAGDVIGFPALASTSMDQARLAVVHAFDLKYRESLPKILPYGLYTIPECSMAGETGESLKEKNIPFVVGRGAYADNVRGQIIGDSKGFLKLIFQDDDEMKLLGVHLIGEQATELIHIGLMVLQVEKGRDLLMATCFNYPTLAEVYKDATFDAMAGRALRWRGAEAPEPLPGRPSSSPPARG